MTPIYFLAFFCALAWAAPGDPAPGGFPDSSSFGSGPGGNMTGPGDDSTSPGGNMTSPGGNMTSPGGNTTSPGGNMTSPGGNMTSPGGNMTSPGGNMTGPGGSMTGPGGNMTGPGGNMTGPGTGAFPSGGASPFPEGSTSSGDNNITLGFQPTPFKTSLEVILWSPRREQVGNIDFVTYRTASSGNTGVVSAGIPSGQQVLAAVNANLQFATPVVRVKLDSLANLAQYSASLTWNLKYLSISRDSDVFKNATLYWYWWTPSNGSWTTVPGLNSNSTTSAGQTLTASPSFTTVDFDAAVFASIDTTLTRKPAPRPDGPPAAFQLPPGLAPPVTLRGDNDAPLIQLLNVNSSGGALSVGVLPTNQTEKPKQALPAGNSFASSLMTFTGNNVNAGTLLYNLTDLQKNNTAFADSGLKFSWYTYDEANSRWYVPSDANTTQFKTSDGSSIVTTDVTHFSVWAVQASKNTASHGFSMFSKLSAQISILLGSFVAIYVLH